MTIPLDESRKCKCGFILKLLNVEILPRHDPDCTPENRAFEVLDAEFHGEVSSPASEPKEDA